MKHYKSVFNMVVILFGCLFILTSPAWAEEDANKWDAAGKEITEAAKAVGDVSGEVWQKTKEKTAQTIHDASEKGAEAWDKTKEKSSELVGKTVEVSGEATSVTAKKSKGFWQKTKEVSIEWYEKAKNKIHEMTGPES